MKKTSFVALCLLLFGTLLYGVDPKTAAKAKRKLDEAIQAATDLKYDSMRNAAEDAVSIDPTLALGYAYVGIARYRSQQPTDAELQFKKALALDPNVALAHIYIGSVFFDQGKLERAFDEWSVGARLEKENPEALASLALGLFLTGKSVEAGQQYKKALMYDRRYYDPKFLADRKKGAAWSAKKVEAVKPLLKVVEKPGFPY